jgi:glycosyltransferase involved in cell wall biosynthesis
MSSIKQLCILGVDGFPYGSARIEKLKLIAKSLACNNLNVDFICSSWGCFEKGEIPVSGNIEGIDYLYTCGITHRPKTFIQRRWINLKGMVGEIRYLLKIRCNVAIVSVVSGMFFQLFYYWILSRLMGFRIYYPHHEEPEVTINKNNLFHRINLYLFNKFVWKMLDGAFPISNYLSDKIKQRNPVLPMLKIPALADFDFFEEIKKSCKSNGEKYFMYCGSLVYYEIIEFLIKAFENVPNSEYNLHLVSFGSRKTEKKLKQRISLSPKKNQIFIFGFLDYKTLVEKYINSSALLIPLRNTIQDIARLPHKIGEYTASGNPVITNNIGDFKYYFENKKNALLAESLCEQEFSNLMNYIIQFPEESKKIGEAGYQTGLTYFNYKEYGLQLKNFMETVK